MIAYLKGKLALKEPAFVIIDVGGIGYHVHIALNTYADLKDEELCHLHTYLHVKEDSQTLYGFLKLSDKQLFLDLISVSGIGPSTGLMMLSSMSSMEIIQAIANEEVKTIQSIKGIGAKTAQRVILELKEKAQRLAGDSVIDNSHSQSGNNIRNEALTALVTLGINKSVAQKSIDVILRNSGNTLTLEELIKRSLQSS